jgi:flagellar protein FlgJ
MTTPVKDASTFTDLSGLAALKRGANTSDPKALREVARQFESVFAKMMLTSMRQASSSVGDSLFGSDQTQFYQGMFDDQLSLELTKGKGLGLADMLVRQLQKVAGASAAADGANLKMPERGSGLMQALDSRPSAAAKMALSGAAVKSANAAGMALPGAAAESGDAAAMALPGATSESSLLSVAAQKAALFSEPDTLTPSDSLDVATRFVQKLLSGNAAATGAGTTDAKADAGFRTPTAPEDFVQQLWPCAEAAGRELGIAPTHLLAQAALETGWGKSLPCDANGNPSFNFFGIKAGADWTGDTVATKTLEFQGGLPTPQVARFRAYDSAQDSFRDYVALLRDNPRYAAALNTGNDAQAFATGLQRGGYATDPAYAQKIASIAQNLVSSANGLKSSASMPIP